MLKAGSSRSIADWISVNDERHSMRLSTTFASSKSPAPNGLDYDIAVSGKAKGAPRLNFSYFG
jgi:hypothetical protein